MDSLIVCGTGHRPEDLTISEEQVREFTRDALTGTRLPITTVVSGMAAGFDLWLADEAIKLGLDVVTVRPWAGHRPRTTDRALYDHIERSASRHIITNDSLSYPGPSCYHVRNEYMVDHSNAVIACWSGKKAGGTYACMKYATKVGKPIRNIIPEIGVSV